ncbi:MAG: hypothetical protein P1V36_17820, partial [Planctomycetota bacterium]|nr:hypothetical protein [Planctomycetota bacterium]
MDLPVRTDLAQGHAALDLVKAMLRDPLTIAPTIDGFAGAIAQADQQRHAPLGALVAAYDRAPWDGGPSRARFARDAAGTSRIDLAIAAGTKAHPAPAPTAAALLAHLEGMLRGGAAPLRLVADAGVGVEAVIASDDRHRLLRRYLPEQMAWHEVFTSPYPADVDTQLAAALETAGDAHIHALGARIPVGQELQRWGETFRDPVRWLQALPKDCFPKDKPLVKDTPYGRIAIGTLQDDVYAGDYAALIDPGGNDRYVACRLGAAYGTENRRVGFFADLGGDDLYDCAEVNFTLGAAILGVAAFLDLGMGDDRYRGGHATLGAAMGGVAVFYDDGGSDVYEGKTFTQGAAGFGVGVFQDDARQERPETSADEGTKDPVDVGLFDNDRLRAWSSAQAFARCHGIALCLNARGNDVYEAGGVYLHAPLFADRYQSFSQGFAIGERGVDYAGGIALIADFEGNDRYLGDIYNQGVGYWYAAGLLYDGGGNDLYEMTQYGQGSGIHLAVGGLVDVAGNDTYVMHAGLGQGGSHDYAASVLHDRGGNDRYHGSTSCNGCGLTNSVGLQIDRAGNDTYGARSKSGILLDLEGTDDYLGVMSDGEVWRHTDIGVGLDVTPPANEDPTPKPERDPSEIAIPKICAYEGELTQEVFDELWAISVRWEVGENRTIVPKARERLIAFEAAILPMLDAVVETDQSGLELRAFVDVLRGLSTGGADAEVTTFLRRNGTAESERRRRIALHLVGELKLIARIDVVLLALSGDDPGLARRAAAVLPKLESDAGNATLVGWLSGDDARARATAVATLLELKADVYAELRPLLDSPDFA